MTQERKQHITFDSELNDLLVKAAFEPDLQKDITPIIKLLLD